MSLVESLTWFTMTHSALRPQEQGSLQNLLTQAVVLLQSSSVSQPKAIGGRVTQRPSRSVM